MTKSDLAPGEWAIERDEKRSRASLNGTTLYVSASDDDEQLVFHRVYKRWPGGSTGRVLVGELDGVRLYVKDDGRGQQHLILTKEDLYF
jgi:hypothetical protein